MTIQITARNGRAITRSAEKWIKCYRRARMGELKRRPYLTLPKSHHIAKALDKHFGCAWWPA